MAEFDLNSLNKTNEGFVSFNDNVFNIDENELKKEDDFVFKQNVDLTKITSNQGTLLIDYKDFEWIIENVDGIFNIAVINGLAYFYNEVFCKNFKVISNYNFEITVDCKQFKNIIRNVCSNQILLKCKSDKIVINNVFTVNRIKNIDMRKFLFNYITFALYSDECLSNELYITFKKLSQFILKPKRLKSKLLCFNNNNIMNENDGLITLIKTKINGNFVINIDDVKKIMNLIQKDTYIQYGLSLSKTFLYFKQDNLVFSLKLCDFNYRFTPINYKDEKKYRVLRKDILQKIQCCNVYEKSKLVLTFYRKMGEFVDYLDINNISYDGNAKETLKMETMFNFEGFYKESIVVDMNKIVDILKFRNQDIINIHFCNSSKLLIFDDENDKTILLGK